MTDLDVSLIAAQRLVDDLDAHEQQVQSAYTEGYRFGFVAGRQVEREWRQHVDEMTAAVVRRHVVALGPGAVPFAQLEERRTEPGPAALAWRQQHGGEYAGGPLPWAAA